jgi:acetate---CoA ligase (ADP-forming)
LPDIGKFLNPKSVAVVGASSDTKGLRGRIMQVMCGYKFAGSIYPVSRSQKEMFGLTAYASVAELPGPCDLAVLIIPAQFVAQELERCGKAGIRAAAILSSGFAEARESEGAVWQAEIQAIAKRYDMAVNGPNSEGFANLAAHLCPTFSPVMEASGKPLLPPNAGRQLAVISQSGGIGFSFFDLGRSKGLAFRYIVTTGNEACLEAFDYVDWMLDEGQTAAYLLFVEDIRNPAMFRLVAEKALKAGTPLIIGKVGQSEPGKRATASHTASLAGSAEVYRGMFKHYGVIEAVDAEEMVDIAAGFATFGTRLPSGKRVAVCTASGGAGAWMADACAAAGLDVPELDTETRSVIDKQIPAYGTSQNPVDITAQAVHAVGYTTFVRALSSSPAVDAIVGVISARSPRFLEHEQEQLRALARETAKPILMWSYSQPGERSIEILSDTGYPFFTSMHSCANTLRAMADYRAERERFLANPPVPASHKTARLPGGPVLCEWEARAVLAGAGIGQNNIGTLARSADEAISAARAIGKPVALKVQSADIPHKTEAGAVAIGVALDDVRATYERILASAKRHAPDAKILGVLVQPMAPKGQELILGIRRDERWGPMLMVGLGGVLVEVFNDAALAPVPLSRDDARRLVGSLRSARLLQGYRGSPPADIDALCELIARLSRFAAEHAGDIEEIDLNPVLVHPAAQGVSVVDALIITRGTHGSV